VGKGPIAWPSMRVLIGVVVPKWVLMRVPTTPAFSILPISKQASMDQKAGIRNTCHQAFSIYLMLSRILFRLQTLFPSKWEWFLSEIHQSKLILPSFCNLNRKPCYWDTLHMDGSVLEKTKKQRSWLVETFFLFH
jgi:hypothetical protein